MPTESNETSQSWFISRMQAAGYTTTLDGCCFGIANMADQAFLAEKIDEFYARLERLSQTPIEQFVNDFSILREKATQLRQSGKTDDSIEADKIIDKIVDFKAFFDGLVLYQSPEAYPDVLPNLERAQDAKCSIELTRSIALEEFKKISVDSLDCLFTQKTLLDFFKMLQTNLSDSSFSIVWGDKRHAVTICYDAMSQEWIWTDANHLLNDDGHITQKKYPNPESITQALLDFFRERLCVSIHLEINTNQKNAASIKSAYAILKNGTAYQSAYHQEALDLLFHFSQLSGQTGYEVFYFLINQLVAGSITKKEYKTKAEILFTKVPASEILKFMCLDNEPGSKLWCDYLILYHGAIPSVEAMSTAEPEVFDVILTAVSKLKLEQQEVIFSQTDEYREDNILMKLFFDAEKTEKILHRLYHFSDEFWGNMLTQTNHSNENVLRLSALFRPECLPLLVSKVAKLPYETQKKILEPTIKILKNWIKDTKDPTRKADYYVRYTMLFDLLKKAREQTKVSVLQQAMKLFRTRIGSQPKHNKEDLSVTRSKNSPESK